MHASRKLFARQARKIHLIGHSLGGIIARSVAAQRPDDVASVITLASPFRGTVAHRTVLQAAEAVRRTHFAGPWIASAAHLLHRPLHVQLSRFDSAQCSELGVGDRHLHAQRRHRRLALLSHRKSTDAISKYLARTSDSRSTASAYTIIANRLAEARDCKRNSQQT